jgi:hypothetical protein
MARISKVPVDRHDGKASLVPRHVTVVRVRVLRVQVESVERLRECIKSRDRASSSEKL